MSLHSHNMVVKCIKSAKIALKFKIHAIAYTVVHCRTSNMTDHRRGPKQKLQAGYTALPLKRTSYLCGALLCAHIILFIEELVYSIALLRKLFLSSSSVVSCAFSALCTRYAHIQNSGILTPRLPLCQILYLSRPPHC